VAEGAASRAKLQGALREAVMALAIASHAACTAFNLGANVRDLMTRTAVIDDAAQEAA